MERSAADTKKRSPVQSLNLVQSRQSLTTVRLHRMNEGYREWGALKSVLSLLRRMIVFICYKGQEVSI